MLIEPPKIDQRDYQTLVEKTRELLVQHYCSEEWANISALKSDKQADTLIHIFSRMMEIIIQRLNKVPDKNFLTFLDLIGVRLSPPKVARAPLTFTMTKGESRYEIVHAGTQIATTQTKEKESVVFETEKDLIIIQPKLVRAVSCNPDNDKWMDHTSVLIDKKEKGIESLFDGNDLVPHRLYLGHNKLFSFKEKTTIELAVTISGVLTKPKDWEVKWYYFDKTLSKKSLDAEGINKNGIKDADVANLLKSGKIIFKDISGISENTLTGFEKETGPPNKWTSYWIFAELSKPIPHGQLPEISKITAGVEIIPVSSVGSGKISTDKKTDNKTVTGAGTVFTKELKRGSSITAEGQTRLVTAIDSDTSLTVDTAFEPNIDNADFTYKSPLFPEKAFFNNFPLELTKDFYSFGEKPKFNDTFHIGSKEAFTKEGAEITIMVALSDGPPIPDTNNIKLAWEFWDGKSWMKIGDATQTVVSEQGIYKFSDQTCAFKCDGKVVFKCPKIEEREINGEKNCWILVRIIGGNYGEEATYEEKIDTNGSNNPIWVYKPPTFKPPSISILTLDYEFKPTAEDFDVVLTYNDFVYQYKTKELQEGKSFLSFQPVTDEQPAFYLSFDQDISTLPVTLFFPLSEISLSAVSILEFDTTGPVAGATSVKLKNVTDLKNGDIIEFCNKKGETEQRSITGIDKDTNTIKWKIGLIKDFSEPGSTIVLFPSPVLAWEYWNGKKWALLQSVEDETKNLTRRGLVQFLAPSDIQQRHCFEFDAEYYWIRARLINGMYETFPKQKGIYTNTVWAHNVVTIKEEILGSSIGKPDQVFKFSQLPVIGEPEIQVLEITITEEDKKAIISDEGKDAVKEIKDESGNITGFWVRWHEVGHFFSSKPNSRHYVIDYNSGEITFGNGERGMIPPVGKDNVKSRYQSGGGVKGNVAAGDITILRTALPFVKSVINPEVADGGGEKEDMDRIRERGPQTLKHRNRAVTYEDFLWLVKAEFPKVAKVKCLPTTDPSMQYKPGWVTLIVVPESEDPKPFPTQQLISEIQSFLFERSSTYITIRPQIHLINPGYIKVWVDARVQYTSITEAKTIESRIIKNLNEFFHPLRWNFGRNVYISEVYEVIENTDGVDYVDQLYLNASIQMYKLIPDRSIETQVSYPEYSRVTVTSDGGNIVFLLAEYLPQCTKIDTMTVMGFKEGDFITLSLKNDERSVDLKVKSVSHENLGDILECEPFMIDKEFPIGSIVKNRDGVESLILDEVKVGDVSLNPIKVAIHKEGDNVVLSHRADPTTKESFKIKEVSDQVETIFIEDNYLIYSGTHTIYSGAEEIERYLININTGEIHDLQNEHPNCHLNAILKKNKKFVRTLDRIDKYDYCGWCFAPGMSKR